MKAKIKTLALENLGCFAIISLCVFVSNLIIVFKTGNETNALACLPTVLLLAVVSFAGVLLKALIPLNVPAIVYTCILATVLSLPCFPWYNGIVQLLGSLQFNAVMTPILAFTGLAAGKDLGAFLKAGPKLIIVSICVFAGTYLGSALISQLGLMITGQI